jgi:hypothetical protein
MAFFSWLPIDQLGTDGGYDTVLTFYSIGGLSDGEAAKAMGLAEMNATRLDRAPAARTGWLAPRMTEEAA